MPADTVDWPWPTKMKQQEEGLAFHLISSMTCKYGHPLDTVAHRMQGWLVASGFLDFCAVRSRLLSGGALDCYSYFVFSTHRFMMMVSIEFGGLNELADVAKNYHTNIYKLYGNFDEFTLAVEKVMRNIVVSMYTHYINLWPINGICVSYHLVDVVDARIHIHIWMLLLLGASVKVP